MNIKIDVITTTFNRAKEIKKLANSLISNRNAINKWIVVDDGSTDDTELFFNDFIKKSSFEIIYLKQENRGKHCALNNGLRKVSANYFCIIDSDDYLLEGLSNYLEKNLKLIEDEGIFCVSGVKVSQDGKPVSFIGDEKLEVMSHFEWFYKKRRFGDRFDIFKSEYLRFFVFNEFLDEKFLTEDVVWLRIPGDKVFINEAILVVDYLPDGLTSKGRKNLLKNPAGAVNYYMNMVFLEGDFFKRMKYIVALFFYTLIFIKK